MSMVTTCPHCQTTFRVTAEQLNARQGEVRCGHCLQIFNAFDSLAPEPQEEPPVSNAAEQQEEFLLDITPPHTEDPVTEPGSNVPEEIEVSYYDPLEHSEASDDTITEEPQTGTEAPPLPVNAAMDTFMAELAAELATADAAAKKQTAASEPLLSNDAIPEFEQQDQAEEFPELLENGPEEIDLAPPPPALQATEPLPLEAPPAQAGDTLPQNAAVTPEPSAPEPADLPFTSTYIPNPAPERKHHTGKWVLANLVLLLTLAGQALYEFRSEIALSYPSSYPYLRSLCRAVGCDVTLPRDLAALDIASSELQALPQRPDIILLTMVLRNQSGLPQTWPTLEVTFTDSDDKPVGRRQLKPVDYLPKDKASLTAGFPPHSETPLKLYISTGSLQPTGYRLLLL